MAKQQQNLFGDATPWEQDDREDRLVASIVLSAVPFGPFDYLVPESLRSQLEPGQRVRVPLGRGNRRVEGYCVKIFSGDDGERRRLKEVHSVVDPEPLLSPRMLQLTEWMADYYLCPQGQVLESVIPSGVRAQAGTREVQFYHAPTNVIAQLTQLKLPKKQAAVLLLLAGAAKPMTAAEICERVSCKRGPVKELERKGLIVAESGRVANFELAERPVSPDASLTLNPQQRQAFDAILRALHAREHQALLLHGVTGSGKTEVYMQAIEEVVSFGRQAIVLVPEISLTPQTVSRFRSRFRNVAVLHSHLSPSERNAHWKRIAAGEVSVVVGARSAVFAPTPHLGLIVLDEEHDSSFKQDSAPRYHTREVALYRASSEKIPVVFGSATPSLESWSRAQAGEFRLLQLPDRIEGRSLPDVAVIDLRTAHRERTEFGAAISRPLRQAMKDTLRGKGQVILLLNRRGFSTNIQCPACGLVVRCPDCEIALTHHRAGERAVCHYCDHEILAPRVCPDCQFEGIRFSGLGTQKLEAEVRALFPDYGCLRMDSDTMRRHGSHEEALERFRAGDVRILLGTQMIAKGLDFPNVTLVGVVNADSALHFPDFRAAERTFQLVTQVAGRTGRGRDGGRVLVQTYSPDHPAILAALGHDFERFASQELPLREEYGYPPTSALARVIMRGPDEQQLEQFADDLGDQLRGELGENPRGVRLLGPAPAPLAKLRGKWRYHLLCLGPHVEPIRDALRHTMAALESPSEVQWVVDIDPQDML